MKDINLHNIVSKEQLHQKAPGQTGGTFTDIPLTTYRLDYNYDVNDKPHAPHEIIDKPYTTSTGNDVKTKTYDYDANGNLTAITQKTGESDVVEKLRTNLWDEENRLRAVDITPDAEGIRPIAIYTYDAGGERILKHSNTSVSIYLNGKKVADTIQTDATIYPSGMLVARVIPSDSEESLSLGYTKHYYAGTQRVSSKIGTTENLGDYLQDWYTSGTGGPIDVIGSSFGVLENAEDGVIQVYEEFDIEPPTYESTPVFIPVQSFIHGGNELEQYYFHPDHLGSTSYITNLLGEVSQHMEYFAFGETFVEEHRSSNNSPYKFNGKELDEETGWYYYGARYYDPRISIWLSVDPLAEQTMTPYVYVNNNPVNLIDPTGMKSETWIVNRDSGEATYIDDGSEDIVIVQENEYNTIIELGQDATGECTGDCNLDSWDMYQDYLKQGERHTSENFSTGNKKADNNIMSLDPRARTPMILSVIQARLEGIDVRGAYLGNHRTYAEQNELYKQGRTKPGGIVTNAVGGQSNHNFGMAMDVAIFDNGKYLKEGTEWQYRRFGEIAESNGLEWGGRWTSPFDPAHVQIKHGYSMKELRALPKDKKGHIIAPLIKEQ